MKYYIKTFGCQMNVYDSQRIARILQNMGHTPAASPAEAGLIIFNTCHIREKAAEKLFSDLGRINLIKEERKAAGLETIIGVVGCVVQAEDGEIARRAPFVNFATGPLTYYRIPEILQKIARDKDLCIIDTEFTAESKFDHLPENRSEGACSYLAVQEGCNNFCTYCIVPYVRGRERSRDPEEIVREAEQLVADGYKELLLLGQNVNSYGRGTDVDFPELLRRINAIPGEFKISYMSSHPKDATHELIDTIAECEKVTRHFHLPVQSGSSRILKLMNRSYTREHYLELINYAKEHIPDVALTSDIIVGFPGETYEDFQETLSLIREVKYDSLFTFIYSPRKGTKAAEMPDPISQEEKGRWFRELLEVQGEIGCSSYHDYIGRTMRVLCEGPGRTRDGCLTGKSIQNIIVDFDGDKSLIGSFVDVKITDALNWALIGELV